MTWRVICADVLEGLAQLPDESVQTVVTSPPYWGLRDYGTASWDGGDEGCDHQREVRPYTAGCIGCGVSLETYTGECPNCDARKRMRDGRGIPLDQAYGPRKPSRGAERDAQVNYPQGGDICGKCGARRIDNQLGLEATPELYVERMVEVFREVRRVLRSDGTVWLNDVPVPFCPDGVPAYESPKFRFVRR